MNDQAYEALLAAVEMDVRAQSKESKALLLTLLKSGAVPREAINRALGQFEGAYYKTLADAYGTVLGTKLGVQQIRELPVSGVKLSDALYAHGKQTSAEVLGIIKRHANAMHDARGLAMQIYDGYGHRAKEVINLNPRNQKLPKYLREALAEDPSLGPSLQRLIAQAQITQIRTPALRAAYQKALDDFEAGAGTRRLDKALDVAYQEKMRYNANRIAQTELHRAYSDQKAREYMAEESLEVVQVRMSGSHPKTDICDLHSKLDKYGLGPGCYPKPLAPKPSYHPHCRCKLVPRWDLSAKGAREQGNAERLFLEDIGEKEGMRIVGSQARYFDIVKRGAKLEEVLNRGKDPLYQFARVGDVAPAPAIAPPVVAPPVITPPTAKGRRYWDPSTPAGQWHEAAFAKAPDKIKRFIERIGDPTEVRHSPGLSAHAMPAGHIEMDGEDANSRRGQSVWRHEFGHSVDNRHTGQTSRRYWSFETRAFDEAIKSDARMLTSKAAQGNLFSATTMKRRDLLDKIDYETATEMQESGDAREWLRVRYAKQGLDYEKFAEVMVKHTDFANTLRGAGLRDRYRRAIVAFEMQDAQGFMDAITGGMQNGQERSRTFNMGGLGELSDLFGSVSLNRVSGYNKSGWGHSDAYYTKHHTRRGTETFANLFAFHGDEDHAIWDKIIDRFTPKTNAAFKALLDAI